MTLEQMKHRAVLLDKPEVPDDIRELAALDMRHWKPMQRQIKQSGVPTAMPFAPFVALLGPEPPIANQTDVTGGTTITLLWDTPNLSPLPPSNVSGSPLTANAAFLILAWGIMTQATTGSQTATFTPGFGTTTGATSLGASTAAPLGVVALTNANWTAVMFVHFRTVGSSGTATCGGFVNCLSFVGVAAGTAAGTTVPFGTGSATATTVNTTAAQGLTLSVTPSLSTQHWQTIGLVPLSLN